MKKILINHRSALALAHDICASMIVWYLAFSLRFNFEIPPEHFDLMKKTIWLTLVVQTAFFVMFGLYRSTWRFASLLDLKRILFTIFAAGTVLALIFFLFSGGPRVPRSVLIINPILLAFVMGGSRFIYRLLKEYQLFGPYLIKGEPVIIYGAGTNAISLLKDLAQSDQWKVVALLDNDEVLHGREILGIKVQGSIRHLAKIADLYTARHIIIASPTINHQERRNILEKANEVGMQVLTIPAIDDLISGRLSVSQIRRVDVEDLLGRDPVNIDISGLKNLISNKTILVSGAGGSIGSELCRQIIKFNPDCIVCLDISEYALYKLEQEFNNQKLLINFVYLVGDIRHSPRLEKIFVKHQPKLVFHAAAYKHVPLMEVGNVSEAFNNNVLGTYILAKASIKAKVDKFILISTDKAVNPANVMGATKRLAEMICQGLQENKGTQFIVVRFGNVLGSSGSVIPKFREQINAGGPVTVTHPDITRYFMSIPEAVQLVMQASLLGKGREIFVLDMGEPVRILDLAKDMIKLSGISEDEIKIVFSGLRPGEKLYEELLAEEELTLPTPHKKIHIAHSERVSKKWLNALLKWVGKISEKDETLIKKELKYWVKGFKSGIKKH
jgi:FlaA1/EpsC-like NDP-sugar epimerase